MDDKTHILECLGAIEEIVIILGSALGDDLRGSSKRQIECHNGINRNVEAIRKRLSKYMGSENMNGANCEKHGRLIVIVLDVDTDHERKFCIECVKELEKEIEDTKKDLEETLGELHEAQERLE